MIITYCLGRYLSTCRQFNTLHSSIQIGVFILINAVDHLSAQFEESVWGISTIKLRVCAVMSMYCQFGMTPHLTHILQCSPLIGVQLLHWYDHKQ
jgi:hypothetical protein